MDTFVDIHCHPYSKPFGQSQPKSHQSPSRDNRTSIWHHDPPTLLDKLQNFILTLTRFRQADLTASGRGNVRVVVNSLYPLERGFCRNKLGTGVPADEAINLATAFGKKYIDRVQAITSSDSYCTELNEQYAFMREMDGKVIELSGGQKARYVLTKNYEDVETLVKNTDTPDVITLAVMLSIEGAHVFSCGIDNKGVEASILENIANVKKWEHRPLFITLAHHFYNELCGHAESLTGALKKALDQQEGLNEGFTQLGEKVVRALLDTANGPRILIDIKHMSEASRKRYFEILDADFGTQNIPIIVSHGCVRGNDTDRNRYHDHPINFSDEEILRVARSGGLFGIQLDERRIGSESALRHARGHINRRDILFSWSELVWLQIKHIAELLDQHDLFAWGNICLGTDYDGIVNPINGYWTHREFPELDAFLLMHVHNYMRNAPPLRNASNRLHEDEIVARFMGTNALDFFKRHYH
ncbi:peptidase M19 [Spirosoma taeanense]|uniref:Peptidase M19 n=1 Tax=Spirosoma taeanense TaxID=2735870 RepID=A0A6M5YA75_9BACT|nr:membrane dipeptidase [Spirosoma taeanense]QJW91108.1 peptidase M19 [Spirosoma taeanense]